MDSGLHAAAVNRMREFDAMPAHIRSIANEHGLRAARAAIKAEASKGMAIVESVFNAG